MAAIKNLCAQISLDLHQWRGYAAVTTSRRPWYIAGKGYWRNTKRCGWGGIGGVRADRWSVHPLARGEPVFITENSG